MNICIITRGYPTPINPSMFVFVDQLASIWADMGLNVTVINPIPLFVELFDKKRFFQEEWIKKTQKGNSITVVSPRYFRASERKIALIDTQRISYNDFQRVTIKAINLLSVKPDILYSHFLPAGCHAGDIGKQLGIPSFCAFGESTLWSIKEWDKERVQRSLAKLNGIISVSRENKKILVENGLFRESGIEVFPNGVDHSLFYQRDKIEIRKKMGFPEDAFIGAYTGAFNDDKGVLRTQEAAIKAGNVQMIYIGGGHNQPKGSNIIFCGRIQHESIPEYLSAADFFLLPTKAEGCCNAIIEAMACGLPIISADGAYNDDILAETYSIRTDPTNIDAMTKAIIKLRDDSELRLKMSIAAREASMRFDIVDRALAIIDFMERKIKEREKA